MVHPRHLSGFEGSLAGPSASATAFPPHFAPPVRTIVIASFAHTFCIALNDLPLPGSFRLQLITRDDRRLGRCVEVLNLWRIKSSRPHCTWTGSPAGGSLLGSVGGACQIPGDPLPPLTNDLTADLSKPPVSTCAGHEVYWFERGHGLGTRQGDENVQFAVFFCAKSKLLKTA